MMAPEKPQQMNLFLPISSRLCGTMMTACGGAYSPETRRKFFITVRNGRLHTKARPFSRADPKTRRL